MVNGKPASIMNEYLMKDKNYLKYESFYNEELYSGDVTSISKVL
jgi:hypothetical protein